jgi:SPP1 family predicted phage head-tail adaptor
VTKCLSDYDKKVIIKHLSGQTLDVHGHVDQTTESNWSIYATAFCKVQTKGGREFWKVQQVNADVSHVWRTQWSKAMQNVTPDMRLIHEGLTYEIVSVQDIDLAHEEIEIQTKRAVM